MPLLLPTGQTPRRDRTRNTYPCHPPHHRLRRRRLGGARNDAASGHGFCPQWQKPQFATRGSPPSWGSLSLPSFRMRRSRLRNPPTPRHLPGDPSSGIPPPRDDKKNRTAFLPCRHVAPSELVRRFVKAIPQAGNSPCIGNSTMNRHLSTLYTTKKPKRGAWVFVAFQSYLTILETTPEPTVLPPSRIAKRRPSSMATGLMSSTVIVTWSPGMTISTPAGSSMEPVTSVVRMKN